MVEANDVVQFGKLGKGGGRIYIKNAHVCSSSAQRFGQPKVVTVPTEQGSDKK